MVIPAAPGFYHRPRRVAELVDFIVQRVLDQLGLDIEIAPRWTGEADTMGCAPLGSPGLRCRRSCCGLPQAATTWTRPRRRRRAAGRGLDRRDLRVGALARVCFPAEWNGDLVIYAHGYVSADEPLAIPDDLLGGAPIDDIVTALGYAFATTSYRANGLVADLAVGDLAQLDERFGARFGPIRPSLPGRGLRRRTGGCPRRRTRAECSTGALAACGPIGDFARQIDYFNDFRVVFDYFFPGVIPGGPVDAPDSLRAEWTATYAPAIASALSSDPEAALELVSVTGAPTDPQDLPVSAGATVIGAPVVRCVRGLAGCSRSGSAGSHSTMSGRNVPRARSTMPHSTPE